MQCFSKSFTSYLHHGSTSEHNWTRFGKLQCTTILVFWPFLVIGHVTTLPITYWMHPHRQNHPCLVFLHLFITIDEISFFGYIEWTLKAVPDILYTIPIFCSHFLVIFRTMKYSGAENEIVIESARHPFEMCNEISGATVGRSQWDTQGYIWKFCNEMLWVSVEKSQWNTQGYIWKTTMKYAGYLMKCAGYVMKNRNEIPRDTVEKQQWNALGI